MEVVLDNATVHYESYGEGRPLVALHGGGSDHQSMARTIEPAFVTRSGWKRIYLDIPGMGRSPGIDTATSLDDVLRTLLACIDRLAPRQSFVLAGYSFGAYLAEGILHHRFPGVDGIFLLTPNPPVPDRFPVATHRVVVSDPAAIAQLTPEEAASYASLTVNQNQRTVEEFLDWHRRTRHLVDEPFVARLDQANGGGFSFDVSALPEPYDRSALVVAGRHDSVVGYHYAWSLLERYHRATFAVLDSAGHALPFEQERLLTALISEWFDRLETQPQQDL